MEVEVICCADDARKFTDILHFVIKEGMDIDCSLKAKGEGSTIFCKEQLDYINFGIQYTHR
jgi:hydrocephalus-inducing protein